MFYNMARRTVGLVGNWDCIAFDEVAGITHASGDMVQIMKNYMEVTDPKMEMNLFHLIISKNHKMTEMERREMLLGKMVSMLPSTTSVEVIMTSPLNLNPNHWKTLTIHQRTKKMYPQNPRRTMTMINPTRM